MPIPTYDHFIEPLLRVLAEHPEGLKASVAYDRVADQLGVTPQERGELLPSGKQAIYKNRIGWAHDRLKRAGSFRRGYWLVTDEGRAFLRAHPGGLTVAEVETLSHVPVDDRLTVDPEGELEPSPILVAAPQTMSPDEQIDAAVRQLEDSVASELLDLIGQAPPEFFEHLVLDLLHKMDDGVDRSAVQRVGKSGDHGIDGIISLDRLGLEKVYVQAKRWQNNVGRPEIQALFGALAGMRASKGVFITTSKFTREAKDYVKQVSGSLVLVDGARLASLMIEHAVGVTHRAVKISSVDSAYFEDA